jgi:hypothetical protein
MFDLAGRSTRVVYPRRILARNFSFVNISNLKFWLRTIKLRKNKVAFEEDDENSEGGYEFDVLGGKHKSPAFGAGLLQSASSGEIGNTLIFSQMLYQYMGFYLAASSNFVSICR